MVNNLNILCVYYIWNKMIMLNSFEPFERAFIAVLKINARVILQRNSNNDLNELIFRNTSQGKLKHEMKKIHIDKDKRE